MRRGLEYLMSHDHRPRAEAPPAVLAAGKKLVTIDAAVDTVDKVIGDIGRVASHRVFMRELRKRLEAL